MLEDRSSKPPFYGWRIAGLSVVIAALTGPGQTIGVSVFIDHFVADFDTTRSTVAFCYLLGTLTGASTLAHWGRAIDRLGVKRATTIIAVAFSLALAAMAGVTGVVTLAAGFVFIRMLGQGALSLAVVVTVARWFERRRGFVLGVVITVSGALMSLVPIALNQGIEAWGWRATWLASAAVIAIVVVPISWLGLIDRPSDVGQHVDGDPPRSSALDQSEDEGVDRATALRTRSFWILAFASACISWLVTALNFHQIALLGEAGLSRAEAAAMFIPQVVGAAVAGIAAGTLIDRFGTRLVPAIAMGSMVLTLLLAGIVDGQGEVIGYAVVLGTTLGLGRTMTTTLVPAWYGTAHLGSITGVLGVITVIASAMGPVALSLTADAAAGWQTASIWWVVAPVVTGIVAAGVKPHDRSTDPTVPLSRVS